MKKRTFKKKKSFHKKRWFLDFVLILVFSLGLAWLLLKTPYFKIEKIEFQGRTEFWETVKTLITKNQNIFLLDSSSLSESIKRISPMIGKVEIKKGLPDKISIKIVEKKEIGIFCQKENCFLLAEDGTIFEKLKGEREDLIKFSIKKNKAKLGNTVLEKELIKDILFFKNELLKINIFIDEILILPFELEVRTKNGFKIFFLKEEFLKQIEVLFNIFQKMILKKEQEKLEYIDLRGERRVYFKFKD